MNFDEMIMATRMPETDSKAKKELNKSIKALTKGMTLKELLFNIERTSAERVTNRGADDFYAAKLSVLKNEVMRRCGELVD